MEEQFTNLVSQIFNNWTALRLAVDHSMGGANSKQAALDFMNYMVQYCLYEQNIEIEGIQDALEDILDEEFETICEDDSPKQIAQILYNFVNLLKQGKTEEFELEFQKLPVINSNWLSQTQTQNVSNNMVSEDSSSDSDENNETPMEQDGWTEVKSRRKR